MKLIKGIALLVILVSPQLVFSAENPEVRYTSKDQIKFKVLTQKAFDHSGKFVTHSVHADGSESANHNGSMGNVTVARIGADGKIETYCTTDEAAAKSFMAGEFDPNRTGTTDLTVRRD